MIDLLESRILFSTSVVAAVVKSLRMQESTIKLDVVAWQKQARSNLPLVIGDIIRLNLTQADAALTKKYSKDGASGLSKLSVDLIRGVTAANLDENALVTASLKAKKYSGNANFAGALAANQKRLSAALALVLNAISADLVNQVTAVNPDLTAIGATSSDIKLQKDISTVEAAISAKAQTIQSQISNVSSTIGLLTSDL